MRIFVPLWHPPEGGYAGGFLRAKRFVEIQREHDLSVADTDSTDLIANCIQGTLHCVRLSWAYARSGALFAVMRIVNWNLASIGLAWLGLTVRSPIDLVYVPYSEILPCALAGFVVARWHRAPLVFCNLNVRGVPLWSLNRFLHRRANAIITLSPALAGEIRAEGIDVPILLGAVGVDDGSVPVQRPVFDAIFVGRHTADKGIFDLISVWIECCRTRPDLRLASAGPCSENVRRGLERILDQNGLRDNVAILGPVSEERKWELYASSRVCLFPSKVEGWGIVPVEAYLAGIPLVAYALPAYEETIERSPLARLVPVGNIDAMAHAFFSALDHPWSDDDRRAAKEWASTFTWDAAVTRELALLDSLKRGTQ